MQDNHSHGLPRTRAHLVLTCAASAMIIGLCTALPATGATFVIAVTASCLSVNGCETPTVIDTFVPIVAITTWMTTALIIGTHQIRTALAIPRTRPPAAYTPHNPPRGIRR